MSSGRLSSDPGLPRGRHKLTRGEVVANQRQRLLDAVPAAVQAKGYAALTVEDVASRAGVSRRTFYENFHDMEDCFVWSCRHHFERVMTAVAGAVAAVDGDWRDRARLGLLVLLRFLASRPDVAQMAVVEVFAAGSEAVAERDRGVGMLAALLGEEALAAAGDPAPRLWLEVIAGAIQQLIYREVIADRTEQLEQLLPTIMYMALVALHGPGGAAAKAGLAIERAASE